MSAAANRRIRVLTFTTLFPSAVRPGHALFVEQRLRHLVTTGEVDARVIAPVPWFPFIDPRFGHYATLARTPRHEVRHGISVEHPRYPLLPKIGLSSAPLLLARGALPAVKRLIASGFDIDVIDSHFYYPDGMAAAIIARAIDRPFTITARGSDINLYGEMCVPRLGIAWTGRRAAASIAVSRALADRMATLGVPGDSIYVLRNGVDLDRFTPLPRQEARAGLGWNMKTALSVGNLIELKGHHIAIDALRELPDWRLVIIGSGEWEARLRSIADEANVTARVDFLGQLPQDQLARCYAAADVLVLASSREGMANVLLEAMACGTPVVATAVGGNPEVVAAPEAGELMVERSVPALADAIRRLDARGVERAKTRAYAERFGWEPTTRGQLEVFRRAMRGRSAHEDHCNGSPIGYARRDR